jgi:FixJ family two-component response regulator
MQGWTRALQHPQSLERFCATKNDGNAMTIPPDSLVAVVDDDESIRESLPTLLRECGFTVLAFASAEALLSSESLGKIGCLVLDIAMPGMTGPELLQELRLRGRNIPTIFITADGDSATRPSLLRLGAVECLYKPFSDTAILEALDIALQRGREDSL